MHSSTLVLYFLAIMMVGELAGQQERTGTMIRSREPAAKVEVVAFEANGRFLGAPHVKVFESYKHQNMASRFHQGVAEGVPYGTYRIEARLPGCSSDVRYVRVSQPSVTVVLGLEFGYELPEVPQILRGRIIGNWSCPQN